MTTNKNISLFVVALLTLLGFGLRLYHIDNWPYRGDEAFTLIHWVNEPLTDTLRDIATVDPHPPLAYALFRIWGKFLPKNELTIRVLPALLNLLSIPAMYALGKRLGGPQMGILAAFLWALNPFQIWHSQDARNYAIWAGFSAVSLWLALRAIDNRRILDWGLYIVVAALAAYVYYLELFVLFTLNVYVLIAYWRDYRILRHWIVAQLMIGLILSPWFLQERLISGGGYVGNVDSLDISELFTWFIPTLTFGTSLPNNLQTLLWPVLAVILVIGNILLFRQTKRYQALFITLLGIVPPILLSIVASQINVFTPRYVLASSPAYILAYIGFALGVGVDFTIARLRYVITAIIIGGWLLITFVGLNNYYNHSAYAKSPGWASLTAYLANHISQNDQIVQAAADDAFDYYYARDDLRASLERLPATPAQSPETIRRILDDLASRHQSLWLVAKTTSSWPNAGIVEDWLDDNMQLVRQTAIGTLPIRQYMNPSVAASEYGNTPLAIFESTATLASANVMFPVEPTDELNILLYWKPIQQTETPLKVFLHLVGDLNPTTNLPIWAQDDQFPMEEETITTDWDVNETYRDVYTLSLSHVPPGDYQLIVGIYDPETGERILTTTSKDSVIIEEVTLS